MDVFQHVLVTLVAAGAATVVVWRVVSAGRSESSQPPCASCASGPPARSPSEEP